MPLLAGPAATLAVRVDPDHDRRDRFPGSRLFAGYRAHVHPGWSLASAVIALVIGVVLLVYPLAGAVALTTVIGVYLLLDGIALIGLALDHRKRGIGPWGWLLASGLIDLLLAAFIVFMSAVGSAVLIGVMVGLSLIFAGIALLLVQRVAVSCRALTMPSTIFSWRPRTASWCWA